MPPGRGRSPPGRGRSPPGRWPCGAGRSVDGADGAAEAEAAAGWSWRSPPPAPGRGPGRGAPPEEPLPPPDASGRGPGVAPGRGAPPDDPDGPGLGAPPPGRGPGVAPGRGLRSEPPPLPPPAMESRSLRATGASTVEDADLTNSPRDSSFVSTCLLVTPSSLASSCTRALPGTDLLILEVSGGPRPRVYACAVIVRASRLAHGGRPASSYSRDGRRACRARRVIRAPDRAVRAALPCPTAPGRATPWGTPTGAPRGSGSPGRGAPTHRDRASDAVGRDRRSRPRPPLAAVPTPRPANGSRCRCAPVRGRRGRCRDGHDPEPPHDRARGFGPPVTLPRRSRAARPRHRRPRSRRPPRGSRRPRRRPPRPPCRPPSPAGARRPSGCRCASR
ncbi:hypothetical protein EV188_101904 [Actinomycetospora succinea]|uniref:Uncharacterized protein n=1 Tax=Actinomycetospora succinea TaxID=663603 RepID=A0A4R6VP28_9PSEU|nr:hypothetical protein EV188_101904 [Actinomycetospora succinea]